MGHLCILIALWTRENFNNISLLPISDSLDQGRILTAAVTLIADCIHSYGLILEDVREAQISEFVIRLRQSLCRSALCFLPEASVTQHVLLTASPPSRRDRVTFLFPPPTHTHCSAKVCASVPVYHLARVSHQSGVWSGAPLTAAPPDLRFRRRSTSIPVLALSLRQTQTHPGGSNVRSVGGEGRGSFG